MASIAFVFHETFPAQKKVNKEYEIRGKEEEQTTYKKIILRNSEIEWNIRGPRLELRDKHAEKCDLRGIFP